ncbi:Cyclic di-GMP phosphodiesterase response regulator RpfG [Rubripirellula obstinata]|uniref:Cyclic di-GMP phosphodiesterase response regulator RpfG n=2 Tax=Rubripirellula obstinata TaxID=406547 RepID=A0A5B1CG54_9BACT|nr:Cyclic di-GMP phosphodiesterase response regulator RpfG [Rubripirellula obstinata]
MLCKELGRRLGMEVNRWEKQDPLRSEIVDMVCESDEQSAITSIDNNDCETSDRCEIGLQLPDGSVACWESNLETAQSSLQHARTIVELIESANQRAELQAENDALTMQVVNDFEELSLIRSLSSVMELPSGGISLDDLCSRSLIPLAGGIGATSIAAVFVDEHDASKFATTWWSGSQVTSDQRLAELITAHRKEASFQPVVRNKINAFDHVIDDEALSEYVLVQCRSEGRLHGWLIACNRCSELTEDTPWAQLGFTTVQASLLETATNQLAAQLHNTRLIKQKEELFTDVVRALVNAVEARDPYTCGHSERVARFARCLAGLAGQPEEACERIYLTGLLHDIGKIAIPDGVLQKPGRLDDDERAIIETHTDAGWRILHELEALRDVLPGVLYHHEQYNGNGYPDGLAGDKIPIDGRILAVCDAFDAMTSDRPYRDGMPIAKAVSILQGSAGESWDPALIETFCANIDKMKAIKQGHRPRKQASRPLPVDGQPLTTLTTNK